MACAFPGATAGFAAEKSAAEQKQRIVDVGDSKQLLFDGFFFASSRGITLKIHPPRKTGEHCLVPDRPWESATLNWFSVMNDDGRYRMWYECYDVKGWPTADDTSFCYAESRDGVHWTKPNLGLFTYHGETNTNILFRQIGEGTYRSRVHGTCVFKDPHAPADRRYKAVSQGMFQGKAYKRPHRIAGMVSADGLHWHRLPKPICNIFADSQYSAFWDETLQRYVLFGRTARNGRAIGRAESKEFSTFPPLQTVLSHDDPNPPDADIYNPCALKYPFAARAYFMFFSLFHHQTQTLDIHLAVSRDGRRWTRPSPSPFLALGPKDAFDSGSLYMGQGLIRNRDEIWMYYSGSPLRHGITLQDLIKPENARIYSRVVSRLDGFVSADAGSEAGWFATPLLTFRGHHLFLNTRVRKGGEIRIGLLDKHGTAIPDFSTAQCRPISGNGTHVAVQWQGGGNLATLAGKPLRMRVQMKDASLYAFRFAGAE